MLNIKVTSGASVVDHGKHLSRRSRKRQANIAAFKLMTTAKENAMKVEYIKKILVGALEFIVLLVTVDLIILFTSLAQIALEGRTGYWNPFWRAQAEFVIKLLLAK